MAEFDRRDFLKLVGVSAGGAAAAGCSDHVEKLIPYVVQPEEVTPGIAIDYSSTCLECSAACGIRARVREGRPIKLEGNPEHPINEGRLCGRGQAGIGRTYHPDRFRGPMLRGPDGNLEPVTWEEGLARLGDEIRQARKQTFVLGGRTGPTLDGLIDGFLDAVGAGGRLVYEPFAYEPLRAATRAVFATQGPPVFDLSGSDYVLDFGSDVLETWISPVEHQRQIEAARDAETAKGRAARFVGVGPRLSMTIDNADEWIPARPGSEGQLALGIAKAAFDARREAGRPVGGDAGRIGRILAGFGPETVADRTGVDAATIRRLGREIAAAERPAALPPGVALTTDQATATTAAVLLLDAVVGAVGRSLLLPPEGGGDREPADLDEIERFVGRMNSGGVAVLLVHDANPVYSMPAGLGFDAALEKVGFVVSFASLPDETTAHADLVLPDHTPLESWGDAAPRPGIRSVVQPSLRPLFDTQAVGDTLLQLGRVLDAGERLPAGSFRSVVEAAWSDTDWRAALQRGGVFEEAAWQAPQVAASAANVSFAEPTFQGEGEWLLLPVPSPLLYDGRGAHLPWLQETPDPVTKICWQSWLEVSRGTAERLGVKQGDVVAVETEQGRALVPVFSRGGIRDDVVALAIGQGHTVGRFAGDEGSARGANVVTLLPAARDSAGSRAWLATRARLSATGAHRRLARTQSSDNKRGRQLAEAISLAALAEGGWNASATAAIAAGHGEPGHGGGNAEVGVLAAGAHGAGHGEAPAAHGAEAGAHGDGHGEAHELLRPYAAEADADAESPYRWGMAIDLDRCTGCSACVVACSIENNIPNVGEQGVIRGRQMHWLRIERYWGDGEPTLEIGRPPPTGNEELGKLDVRHSPQLCQQCGAAPCEPVCPVFATYHTPEGLNGMIYNRCIGTRYCSNNCPYKVRRFNWYDYAIESWPEPMQFMLNPDVTVRGQGVMEKCNFCVQRINTARQTAKDEGRPIADGEVTPACAATCPSQAIVFGNLRDEKSEVVQTAERNAGRDYHALQVLNTRPAITYLAKLIRDEEDHQA